MTWWGEGKQNLRPRSFLRGAGGVSSGFGYDSIVEVSLLKPERDAMVEDLGECMMYAGTMIFLQYFTVYRENKSLNAEAWSKPSDPN